MRQIKRLTIISFPDLLPWQRASFDTLVASLSGSVALSLIEAGQAHENFLARSKPSDRYWVLADKWQDALTFLGASQGAAQVFVSVLRPPVSKGNLMTLLWRHWKPQYPENITLVTHSDLSHRFFCEIAGIDATQVRFAPLCVPAAQRTPPREKHSDLFTVGTFANFTAENNLNYFLNVAHYVINRHPTVRFRVLGQGPLYSHLTQITRDLDLENRVEVIETVEADAIADLDLFLYVPLRNDHLIPLLWAAHYRIPTLCSDLPELESLLLDGKSTFFSSSNDTRSLGELVLRIVDHSPLRNSLAQEFSDTLHERFNAPSVLSHYLDMFASAPVPQTATPLHRAA